MSRCSPRAARSRRTAARSRTPRGGAAGAAPASTWSTNASSVPAKSRPRSRASAASWPATMRSCSACVGDDGVDQRRDVGRVARSYSTPAPSIVAGTAVARVGQHRDLLVERLDERHAEPLVLARAQEEVGDVVVRRQLLVRDVAEEVHVRRRRAARRAAAASRGTARTRCTTPTMSSRDRGLKQRLVGVEEADDVLDPLVRDHPARQTGCSSTRRRTGRATQPVRRRRRGARSPGTTGSTPVAGKPSASSSWRLNSESPSARSQRVDVGAAARGGRGSTAARAAGARRRSTRAA